MTFNTAHLLHVGLSLKSTASEQPELATSIRTMIDAGAPYSATGFTELSAMSQLSLSLVGLVRLCLSLLNLRRDHVGNTDESRTPVPRN